MKRKRGKRGGRKRRPGFSRNRGRCVVYNSSKKKYQRRRCNNYAKAVCAARIKSKSSPFKTCGQSGISLGLLVNNACI